MAELNTVCTVLCLWDDDRQAYVCIAHFGRSLKSELCKNKTILRCEAGVTTCFVVVHLSGLILANPATLRRVISGCKKYELVACRIGLFHRRVKSTCKVQT